MDEEIELFDGLSKTLATITTNLHFIYKCVADCAPLRDLEKEIHDITTETQVIKNGILDINEIYLPHVQNAVHQMQSELKSTHMSLTQAMRNVKKYNSESQILRQESKALKVQSTNQENLISSLKSEFLQINEQVNCLQEQLSQERNVCTSIGSTLSCMLWRACREPEVVNSILAWYKFPEFLKIATGTLESFTNTYIIESNEISIPAVGSEEGHFVAGMIGTVTNMSASPSGREILLSNEPGQQLLVCMVEALGIIPAVQGEYLRRLLLMAIYNVIIEEVGLNFLIKLGGLPMAVGKNILGQEEECLALSLHILSLYTASIPMSAITGTYKNISIEDLKRIAKAERGENSILAMEILRNLKMIA